MDRFQKPKRNTDCCRKSDYVLRCHQEAADDMDGSVMNCFGGCRDQERWQQVSVFWVGTPVGWASKNFLTLEWKRQLETPKSTCA